MYQKNLKKNVLDIWESVDNTMKKKEKYSKEIVEIICNGKNIAVDKKTERPVVCSDFDCDKCMFRAENNCRRRYLLKEWAESEYIEKPVISKKR